MISAATLTFSLAVEMLQITECHFSTCWKRVDNRAGTRPAWGPAEAGAKPAQAES